MCRYSPIGNCFLVCSALVLTGDLNALFKSIPFYILTMVVSLIAQGLLLAFLYLVVTRKNVFKFVRNIFEALVLAMGTSSRWEVFKKKFKIE